MIRAYDDDGNLIDLVKMRKQIKKKMSQLTI